MDQKTDPPSSSPKLLTFDALVANDFIVKKDETKGVPTLEKVKDKFSKKRKSRSSESTGSNTSILAAGENRRSSAYNYPSLGTPATQIKPQPPASPAPILLKSHSDTNHLLMMVGRLKKQAAAIIDRIIPSVVPDAQDRFLLTQRVVALQQVVIQLNEYAQVDANHSAPEDLWRIEGLLWEAINDFRERIRTSVISDAEDRLFFVRAVSALLKVLLQL